MSIGEKRIDREEQKAEINEIKNLEFLNSIFEGPIVPISIKIAVPLLIGNLIMLFYYLVNTFFISMIDKQSTAFISGIGLVLPLYTLYCAIASGFFVGTSAIVAIGIGEKDNKLLDKVADSSLLLGLIIAILTLFLGYLFGNNIVQLLAGSSLSKEAIESGLSYLYFLLPGMGLILFAFILAGILQGEGLAKYVSLTMLLSAVLNIILDPVLIFLLRLGVAGAALGTTISVFITGLYAVTVIKNKSRLKIKLTIFNTDRTIMYKIIGIGLPQLLVLIAFSFRAMYLNNLVGSISENAMNAWTLVTRMDQIFLLVGSAFATSAITLCGQNYGRNNIERVWRFYKINTGLGMATCAVLALLYVLSAHPLFSLFSAVPDVVNSSVTQVRLLSFTYLGIVAALISNSAFQATGKPWLGFIIIFIEVFILTIPLAFLLVVRYNMGIYGVYAAVGIENILVLFIAYIWSYIHLNNLKKHKESLQSA